MTRRKGDNYLRQEKQKQPRPHYALISKTIIWYGFLVLCLAGVLVQTYIHTYIHYTHIVELLLPEPCSDGLLLCLPEQVFPRIHCRGNARGESDALLIARYVCMYVCMYVFIRILPAGWEACQFIQSMHDSVSDTETAVILYLIH